MMGTKWDWKLAGVIVVLIGTVMLTIAAFLSVPVFFRLGVSVTFIGLNIYVLESAGLIPRSCAGEV